VTVATLNQAAGPAPHYRGAGSGPASVPEPARAGARGWLYAVAGAALCLMLPGSTDPYIGPKTAALGALALALLLRPADYASSARVPVLAAFGAWLAVASASSSPAYTGVGTWLASFDGFTAVAVYLGLFLGAARLGRDEDDVAVVVCWAAVPMLAYALLQRHLLNADPLLPSELPAGRIIATQGSPVYLGAVLALVGVCAVWVMLTHHRRLPGAVAAALTLPAIHFTQTRGAILGVAAGLFVLLPRRARWVCLAAGAAGAALHPRVGAGLADAARWEVWRIAWAMFLEAPLVGHGPGTFAAAFRQFVTPEFVALNKSAMVSQAHAHGNVLHVLATTGLVGLAAWGLLAWTAWRLAAGRPLLRALGAAYLAVGAFNPVPTAATALLCLAFGAASARPARAGRPWAVAAAVAAALVLAVRVAVGDWYYAAGVRGLKAHDSLPAAEGFHAAATWNPWEPQVVARQIDSLLLLTARMPEPEDRLKALGWSLGHARRLAARQPNDSGAREIYGRSLMMTGAPERAMAEYRRAAALAPTFPPVWKRILGLAQRAGDAETAREAAARLVELDAWAGKYRGGR